jgi:simple sugar transport system ATP-binding protein
MDPNAKRSEKRSTASALLEMNNISKSFGHVTAIQKVDFRVEKNEIVGLVGDNGAGKSTLIKIITGVVSQDSGTIIWKGNNISKHSVKQSRELGIETVYQDRALGEKQNIWRNIFMGRELTFGKTGFVRGWEARNRSVELLRNMGFTQEGLDPDLDVSGLSGGEKQGIAITRALYFDAELIILDEPTNNLSITETNKVLNFVKEIKKQSKSCIFITHNIYHVYPVADRFAIVDRGKIVGEYQKKKITLGQLVDKMKYVAAHGAAT